MATRTLYLDIDFAEAKAHDDALLKAQTALLENVAIAGSGTVARNYAEAYALISGHISSTSSTEVKG